MQVTNSIVVLVPNKEDLNRMLNRSEEISIVTAKGRKLTFQPAYTNHKRYEWRIGGKCWINRPTDFRAALLRIYISHSTAYLEFYDDNQSRKSNY